MNIIIKTHPSWRSMLPDNSLGKFKTLHPKGLTDKHLSVEEQYSPEELKKIQDACHLTKKLISEEELHKNGKDIFK